MSTTKWALDPTHSEINFKIKHMMISNVTGSFTNFNVTAETDGDNFANSKVSFTTDVNSINTNNEQRDGHLKSADFLIQKNILKLNLKELNSKKHLMKNMHYMVI